MENFKLKLKQMHPGVVDMDAYYEFYCEYGDKILESGGGAHFMLITNEPSVKVNGTVVIVPYELRQQGKTVKVTALLNDYMGKQTEVTATDTFDLSFNTAFEDEPSLFDDFETLDTNIWTGGEEGWEYGKSHTCPYVENSNLVLHATKEDPRHIITTAHSFQQTYGCFSASMKFPEYTNTTNTCNCAFWLCSNVLYPEKIMFKRNPQSTEKFGRDHAGEIDIVEYSPAFGDYTTASYHHFGWSKYIISDCKGELPAPGIREGYHTMSLVWEPDALYWYYDGKLLRTCTGEGIKDAGKEPGGDMVVLFQCCIHKLESVTWIGTTFERDFPMDFLVDWVKVNRLKK